MAELGGAVESSGFGSPKFPRETKTVGLVFSVGFFGEERLGMAGEKESEEKEG